MATPLEPKLIRLVERLDSYHKRRADAHGYLYTTTRSFGLGSLIEAKSIATGALCTLDKRFIEGQADATELQTKKEEVGCVVAGNVHTP